MPYYLDPNPLDRMSEDPDSPTVRPSPITLIWHLEDGTQERVSPEDCVRIWTALRTAARDQRDADEAVQLEALALLIPIPVGCP
jgi:hypothetical protein